MLLHAFPRVLVPSLLAASTFVTSPARAEDPGSAPPTADDGSRRTVRVEADAPVTLQAREPGNPTWVAVCSSPCSASVPVEGTYRTVGPDVRRSKPFQLAPQADTLRLDVVTAPKGRVVAGAVAAGVGGGVVIAGGAVLYFDWLAGALSCVGGSEPYGKHCGMDDGVTAVGVTMIGVGVVTALVGTYLLVSSRHTEVHQSPAGPIAALPALSLPALSSPTWREDRSAAWLPRATNVPLLRVSF